MPTSRKATTEQLLCCENHRAVPDGGSGDREGGQVVVSGAWTRSVDDVNFFCSRSGADDRGRRCNQWRINHDANDAMAWGPPLKGAPEQLSDFFGMGPFNSQCNIINMFTVLVL